MQMLSVSFNKFAKSLVTRAQKSNSFCKFVRYTTCSKSNGDNRNKYHEESEKAVNQQITVEFSAGYTYLSMACFFGRTTVALPGCHGYFYRMYEEELEHALVLINYQNMRGGRVILDAVKVDSDNQDWKNVQNALAKSLELEMFVKEKLVAVNDIAVKHKDWTLSTFLNDTLLPAQDESLCEIGRLLTRANKIADDGIGEYLFDKEMYEAFARKDKTKKLSAIPDVYK